jgi:hypothetical protein
MFDGFMIGVIGVCALGSLLNLAMVRKRGVNAILMALSFLLLGFSVTLYRIGAPTPLVAISGTLVFVALIADFVLRTIRPRTRK